MTREEAIEWVEGIKEKYIHGGDEAFDDARRKALDMAIEALSAETVQGEWIRWVVDIEDETGVSYIPHAKCSNCGTEQDSYTSQFINFCPNCGAKMGGVRTNDKGRSN